ncbi:zinc finger, RING/FYVE/PHD-type [Artemisia annua]|uniref:Zinc finger, RING/FYVE/PHD-type n=1 Tax=Artemisia annua TaxID=35608 RepID=A0A2U1KQE1_ARTAN|nr:zinc finger, RING/FYVE/PHD-type [Artemisia annua]
MVDSDGKTTLEGLVVDWPILGRSKNISVFKDVCSICFKAMTGAGQHRICCLPCGHIYGRSCINQWLQQSQNCSKCPQCKSLCTLKDVTPLYATLPCDDAVGALPKVSTKRFPFTKQGFKAFKRYAMRRLDDESAMRLDAARRRDYVFRQRKEIYRRWSDIPFSIVLDDATT